jgi:phospholipase/carboxylesterase
MKFDPESWSFRQAKFGDLDTALIAPVKQAPKALVVLSHGYGAPGTDLIGLFDTILHQLPESSPHCAYLFPEGLVSLDGLGIPDGRAWWPLNMMQMMQMAEKNRFDAMRDAVPPEIDAARNALVGSISACRDYLKSEFQTVSACPLILGGFSQGAMLSVDTLLRGNIPGVVGLIAYSGALICESLWRAASTSVIGIPFIQSHGRQDPILPFETGCWLNELLVELGMSGSLLEFDGPHTIPNESLLQTAKLIHAIAIES